MPGEFGYTLITPPAPTPGSVPDSSTSSTGQPSFFGSGILRPFQRDQKNDFAHGTGLALIAASVAQVLGTKAGGPGYAGEVPWRTQFGSRFHLLRHRNRTETLVEVARFYAGEALGRWLPSVRVTAVEAVTQPGETNTTRLRIRFDVVDTSGTVQARDLEAFVPLRDEG